MRVSDDKRVGGLHDLLASTRIVTPRALSSCTSATRAAAARPCGKGGSGMGRGKGKKGAATGSGRGVVAWSCALASVSRFGSEVVCPVCLSRLSHADIPFKFPHRNSGGPANV